jgi:hypothetical protein
MMGMVAGSGGVGATAVAEAAAGRKGKKFTLHIKTGEIAQTNGEHVVAGDTQGTLGLGAIALHTATSPTASNCKPKAAPDIASAVAARALVVRCYLPNGSFKCRVALATSAPRPDGTVQITGAGAIIGGGGEFSGARGRVHVSGTRPANKSNGTFVLNGMFTA